MELDPWTACLTCHTRVCREDWEKHRDWHYAQRDALKALQKRLFAEYRATDALIDASSAYRG